MPDTGKDNQTLVCLGDSIGTNYKLRVRANSFAALLARRLGLDLYNDSVPGATTGHKLKALHDNEEMTDAVRRAKVIVLACGTNNVLMTGLEYMGRAAGIDVTSWRLLIKIIETIRTNPIKTVKMVAALNSKEAERDIGAGVQAFKKDMPVLIDHIRELNPDAIIVALTIYTMSDVNHSLAFKLVTKSQARVIGDMNQWMHDNLPEKNALVCDLAAAFRAYRGKEELTNLNIGDGHLSDAGHLFTYRLLYDTITGQYPELAREEGPDIIRTRKRKTREERLGAKGTAEGETDSSRKIRQLIEQVVNRDDLAYDEYKQFCDMGITAMDTHDIARAVEKEFFGGREVLGVPTYDYATFLRPHFFVDYLDGNERKSILSHKEDLAHYASAEEKREAEQHDPPALKVLKKHIYAYLQDDMVRLDADTSYFGTLQMNCIDWYDCVRPAELELDLYLVPVRTPSPETVTLGEIAAFVERGKADLQN